MITTPDGQFETVAEADAALLKRRAMNTTTKSNAEGVQLAPYPAAQAAEKRGDMREAARLYKRAGDEAAGHSHAERCYYHAQRCISQTPDDPSATP